jgi:hypothetical protein
MGVMLALAPLGRIDCDLSPARACHQSEYSQLHWYTRPFSTHCPP